MNDKTLCMSAINAMNFSYSPYSECKVGAALLSSSGKVYTGCNIENASFSPTVCAERTAFFKAISEGEREFVKIAVAGGEDGIIDPGFTPCGVCRQVMAEFCRPDFRILIVSAENSFDEFSLAQLLPEAFKI